MNQKQALQTFGRSGNPMFSDQTFSEKIIDVSLLCASGPYLDPDSINEWIRVLVMAGYISSPREKIIGIVYLIVKDNLKVFFYTLPTL